MARTTPRPIRRADDPEMVKRVARHLLQEVDRTDDLAPEKEVRFDPEWNLPESVPDGEPVPDFDAKVERAARALKVEPVELRAAIDDSKTLKELARRLGLPYRTLKYRLAPLRRHRP